MMLVMAGSAMAVVNVTSCRDSYASWATGETYVLTQNIVSTGGAGFACMQMGVASGSKHSITLDCNGFNITYASGLHDYGIYIRNAYNVIVKNCNIKDFKYGITLYNADNSIIKDNLIKDSKLRGVDVSRTDCTGNLIQNNEILNSKGTDISNPAVMVGAPNTFRDNIVSDSSGIGLYILNTQNVVLQGNIVDYSNKDGVYINQYATNNHFTNNRFCNNNQANGGDYDVYDESPATSQNFNGIENCDTSNYASTPCDLSCTNYIPCQIEGDVHSATVTYDNNVDLEADVRVNVYTSGANGNPNPVGGKYTYCYVIQNVVQATTGIKSYTLADADTVTNIGYTTNTGGVQPSSAGMVGADVVYGFSTRINPGEFSEGLYFNSPTGALLATSTLEDGNADENTWLPQQTGPPAGAPEMSTMSLTIIILVIIALCIVVWTVTKNK